MGFRLYLSILRQLGDQLQYETLKHNAEQYLLESGDVQALPLKILAQLHLGERAAAMASLEQLTPVLSQLDSDAQADMAAVYCLMWRIEDAIALLMPVLAATPDHSLAQARLAWCLMHKGEFNEARDLYRQSAAQMPDRLPVWAALIRLYIEAHDYVDAQAALDMAIDRLDVLHTDLPEAAVAQFTAQFRGLQLEVWVAGGALATAEEWLSERQAQLDEDAWAALVSAYAVTLGAHHQHAVAEDALREGLKHYPENMTLVSQLAELAQLQGRTQQAVQLLRRLIVLAKKQEKPEAIYWIRLSGACLIHATPQARKAAEKATTLVEEMTESDETPDAMIKQLALQAKNAVAQLESQEQHFDVAEKLFNEILAENAYFVPALQGLGQQQMQRGNIDDAVAMFERIKEIDPAKGYSSLINARRFPDDDETLKRMEKAARQPSMEGQVRAGLLLQLASAWEKRKDYDKAFALATEANDASKHLLEYDTQAHRQRCARIRYAFGKPLFEHRKGYGDASSLPVFVLGMPRSGTTLVEQILAGHSKIFGAGELGIVSAAMQGLSRWERHTGSGRQFPDCVDDVSPELAAKMAKNVLKELQEYDPKAKHVVDKMPHNFENIGFIKFLFPNARIISVRRDPRDIAISNYFTDYQAKHGGMGFAYDLNWIGQQLADHNLMMHHWNAVFPGEILEVNYEDVVEDTEGMARKMLDYIGVEWEPKVLAFNELDRTVKTASVWQVRQPIYKTSKAKWMRYESHLAPLIAGTNKAIEWETIEMISLPEPAMLTTGVALFKAKKLDEAEYEFGKLLHHIPNHAAANFMLGLVYIEKGHVEDAIALMEKGHEVCPWNKEWRADLIQAYTINGDDDKVAAMKKKFGAKPQQATLDHTDDEWAEDALDDGLDNDLNGTENKV